MKPEDTKVILGELEQGVGFVECNTLVIGLLREALVAQARAALARLSAAERGTSMLLSNLGRLLKDMGQLEEARPLYEEALQARRETLGDRDPGTLNTMYGLAAVLKEQDNLAEAILLFTEELEACVLLHGMTHTETSSSATNLVHVLHKAGQREEAEALAAKHGV